MNGARRDRRLMYYLVTMFIALGVFVLVMAAFVNRDFSWRPVAGACVFFGGAWMGIRSIANLRRQEEIEALELHLCPTCGYDLRATPGRCPECGTDLKPPMDAGERR